MQFANSSDMSALIVIIAVVISIIIAVYIYKNFKFPKTNALTLVTGGVKTGKSTFSVALVFRRYKSALRRYKILCFFAKLFNRKLPEKPLIYSNIPLACDYVDLTEDLILRNKRFRYKSVVYVNEASLVADSQLFRDMELNERISIFNKLIGHELKGGQIIYDTQQVCDTHYGIKRNVSEYFYIHHLTKWIPFFLLAYVMECRYSEDGSVSVTQSEDLEKSLVRVIIPKCTWKKFDAYAFSSLTDNLPIEDTIIRGKELSDLKIHKITSFRTFKSIPEEFIKNEKENS